MNKSATYDDISEIIKERVDNFELKDNILEERLSIEAINEILHDLTEFGMDANYITSNELRGIYIKPIDLSKAMHAVMPAVIGRIKHNIIIANDVDVAKMREPLFPANKNTYYPRNYESKNTMELVDAILFQEEKQPKDNHPHGWYRKFEKKRF